MQKNTTAIRSPVFRNAFRHCSLRLTTKEVGSFAGQLGLVVLPFLFQTRLQISSCNTAVANPFLAAQLALVNSSHCTLPHTHRHKYTYRHHQPHIYTYRHQPRKTGRHRQAPLTHPGVWVHVEDANQTTA